MKEIGGYFGLEYSNVEFGGIHNDAVRLNAARYCLEYIVKARKYTKVYVPYFICGVIFEPLRRNNIEVVLYHIDRNMELVSVPDIQDGEGLLYINYFGFKNEYIKGLAGKIRNLIVDNCQALFAEQLPGVDTFYSLRKYVPLPDGAFVYCGVKLNEQLPVYNNVHRVSHLYLRANIDANTGFPEYQKNENLISEETMSYISPSSENFIKTYDFSKNQFARDRNFVFLHLCLEALNEYKAIDIDQLAGPLYYPFLLRNEGIRMKMISNRIYINVIWPDLDPSLAADAFENYLANNLLPLPIDQRYDLDDMKRVVDVLTGLIRKA